MPTEYSMRMETLVDEKDRRIAELEAQVTELEPDAKLLRRIREARKGRPVGWGCCCEFDEEDNRIRVCTAHQGWLDRADAAEADLATARETNRRLNARCQLYEKGIAEKVKDNPGPSFGRALANAEAERLHGLLEAAEAERDALKAECERLRELEETLVGMVDQHCWVSTSGVIDSMAISANADALHLLSKLGRFEITKSFGRRVIGTWKDAEDTTP
ncbi:MAG: hypothetical protein ACPGVG_05345 [Mycobacterium sp.]